MEKERRDHAATSSPPTPRVFVGASEVVPLIRAQDWSPTGLGPVESWPPSLRAEMNGILGPMIEQVVETGEPIWLEDQPVSIPRDGSLEEAYFTFSSSPIRDEAGQPRGVFGTCIDTTARVLDRRRLETLRELALEARSPNEAARLCVEALGRSSRDVEFALLYLSDGASDRLHLAGNAGLESGTPASPLLVDLRTQGGSGWPLAEVMADGRPEAIADLPRAPSGEPARKAVLFPLMRLGASKPAGVLVLGVNPRCAFDDGYRRFFELVARQVASVVSSARGYEEERQRAQERAELERAKSALSSAVVDGAAQRTRLEEELRQAQKMEAVGRLAGGLAHDFNNMLSVILSYAEIMIEDLDPEQPLRADAEEIRTAGARAADLTRQLLAFSRQQVLSPKVLDLNQSVTGIEKMINRLLGSGVQLTTLLAARLGSVTADPGQIEQIIVSLAVNARDAMPRGGTVTITTANVEIDDERARAHHDVHPGPYVMLEVTDSGAGIDEEAQARIFEPFFTTNDKRLGTGLGLATVFGIVKQSGGHIVVSSEPQKGTAFKVYLPRVTGATEVSASLRPGAESVRGTETILLVEDDDQVRTVARNILRRSGYVVLEAENAGEALLICEEHRAKIHLLLTDAVLPRMNGRQLAERLATLRPGMKVLFMSGYTDDVILQQDVRDSGVAYLQKPLTPALLKSKVRDALSGAASG